MGNSHQGDLGRLIDFRRPSAASFSVFHSSSLAPFSREQRQPILCSGEADHG